MTIQIYDTMGEIVEEFDNIQEYHSCMVSRLAELKYEKEKYMDKSFLRGVWAGVFGSVLLIVSVYLISKTFL